MGKVIKVEMYNSQTCKMEEKEFEVNKNGVTAFQYQRDFTNFIKKGEFDGLFGIGVKYFPTCIGKEAFEVEGFEGKFSEQLEEYFADDPNAMIELVTEMGFILSPSLKLRAEKLESEQK